MNSQTFEYSTIAQSILDNGLFINNANFRFTKQDIFEYDDTPNEYLYNINFQFGQGNMEWHREKYGINPSYYVFTNDQRINAFAAQINGYGLVGINMGLIHFLITNFHNKYTSSFTINSIKQIASTFNVSILAALIRFVDNGSHPIFVVYCKDNKVVWYSKSNDFPKWAFKFNEGQAPPAETVLGDFISN